MDRRRSLALLSAFACGLAAPRRAAAAELPPETIFGRAKEAWRARGEAPFVTFSLRERYEWRGATHDNWWHAAYRDADGALALTRLIVPGDEAQRMRGSAIALDFNWHHGSARADSLDTNANADAFPILDPLIEPNASFGLLHGERKPELVGAGPAAPSLAPSATPDPVASASSVADGTLRELVRVEAVSRDYTIAMAGTERIRGTDVYHLTLTPLRSPNLNRLRDLWVDTTTFETLGLAAQGLFDGKPYSDARWLVGYVKLAGRNYVQQIRTDETLRFGLDRYVTGLTYDFVAYEFPDSIAPIAFERLL